MLFNSQAFFFFLPVVFLAIWSAGRLPLRAQNFLLCLAGYYFYGRWDWRFLGLLLASTVIDFLLGLAIDRAKSKKPLLVLSLVANLGLLGFFKYFDFFAETLHLPAMRILLPVGISFYTFQSLSYTIDVYRGKMRATTDFFAYAAFVSFFPQLVAGPIGRASEMLPQFLAPRTFNPVEAHEGLRRILWGFFKKVVVADNLAGGHPILFAIQIYCDFSGYSDIAIGTAKLFGFRLKENFRTPYFATNIADFWRRWHISLSTWFRDYVYIPLGGSKSLLLSVMVTFTLSGLWHGAKWTFVAWGAVHGIFYLIWRAWKWPLPALLGWLITIVATTAAWELFRADSLRTLFVGYDAPVPLGLAALGVAVLLLERFTPRIAGFPAPVRWTLYYASIVIIFLAGNLHHVPFIYFRF